jgi:hypothetical protein
VEAIRTENGKPELHLWLINIHLRVKSRIKLVYFEPSKGLLGSEVKTKIMIV